MEKRSLYWLRYSEQPQDGGGCRQFWLITDADGANPVKIPFALTMMRAPSPVFSPDGTKLAYTTAQGVCMVNSDGTGAKTLARHDYGVSSPFFSPDGKFLHYYATPNMSGSSIGNVIYQFPTDGSAGETIVLGNQMKPSGRVSLDSEKTRYLYFNSSGLFNSDLDGKQATAVSPGERVLDAMWLPPLAKP